MRGLAALALNVLSLLAVVLVGLGISASVRLPFEWAFCVCVVLAYAGGWTRGRSHEGGAA